jgi:hypothetical protein
MAYYDIIDKVIRKDFETSAEIQKFTGENNGFLGTPF